MSGLVGASQQLPFSRAFLKVPRSLNSRGYHTCFLEWKTAEVQRE